MNGVVDTLAYAIKNISLSFYSNFYYRAATVLKLVSQILILAMTLLLWSAIYSGNSEIKGVEYSTMMSYYIITFALSQFYSSGLAKRYAGVIKNGDIYAMLLKPVNIEIQFFTQNLGKSLYQVITIGLPVLILGYVTVPKLNRNFDIYSVLIALCFIILYYIFNFYIEMFVGTFSFYTTSIWGIDNFRSTLVAILSGEWIPLSVYPSFIRPVLKMLPFSSMFYIPSQLISENNRSGALTNMLILICSIFIIIPIYYAAKRRLIKYLTLQGG